MVDAELPFGIKMSKNEQIFAQITVFLIYRGHKHSRPFTNTRQRVDE